MRGMKRFSIISFMIAIFLSLAIATEAGDAKLSVTWDPPGFYAKNSICDDQTLPITPEDLAEVTYILNYRVKGAPTWTGMASDTNSVEIGGLDYSTTYEVQVGAKFSDTTVLCFSGISEATTPVRPPPGLCPNPNVTAHY